MNNTRERREHIEGVNKFLQGSIWHWKNPNSTVREGVQAGSRPVLIISNDIFNKFSPVVNCVSITTNIKNSRVHEPVFITRPSHIQCEQIHTISKEELVEYLGTVEHSTMSNVKAKLKIQFGMGDDRHLELLAEVRSIVDDISRKIISSEDDEADVLAPAPNVPTQDAKPNQSSALKKADKPEKDTISKKTGKSKQVHRKYTDEDRAFILDRSNSTADLMERFGYKDKIAANSARTYIRKISQV